MSICQVLFIYTKMIQGNSMCRQKIVLWLLTAFNIARSHIDQQVTHYGWFDLSFTYSRSLRKQVHIVRFLVYQTDHKRLKLLKNRSPFFNLTKYKQYHNIRTSDVFIAQNTFMNVVLQVMLTVRRFATQISLRPFWNSRITPSVTGELHPSIQQCPSALTRKRVTRASM